MTLKNVPWLLASFLVFALIGEAHAPDQNRDYNFNVTGIVTSEDGARIQNAEVILELNGPVYDGVELVKRVQQKTNDTGGFVFAYISHKRGVKYTISVHQQGFESATVNGSAPPAGHHTIRLRKAVEGHPDS